MTSTNNTINNNNILNFGGDSSGSAFTIFVAVYLDINTGSAEREVENIVEPIHSTLPIFKASDLSIPLVDPSWYQI